MCVCVCASARAKMFSTSRRTYGDVVLAKESDGGIVGDGVGIIHTNGVDACLLHRIEVADPGVMEPAVRGTWGDALVLDAAVKVVTGRELVTCITLLLPTHANNKAITEKRGARGLEQTKTQNASGGKAGLRLRMISDGPIEAGALVLAVGGDAHGAQTGA